MFAVPTAPARRSDASDQLASAAAVVAGAERHVDRLWCAAVADGDADLSERLAELSHALRARPVCWITPAVPSADHRRRPEGTRARLTPPFPEDG